MFSKYNDISFSISTMDKSRKGLLVQMDGHIGIYIGNNEVIECTTATQFAKQSHGLGGVCKTKLSDCKWLHWLKCPYIDYVKETTSSPTTSSSTQGILTVASGTWNVRKGAGTNYGVVKVVKGGTKLEYLSIENGWYKLNDGYISSKAVKGNPTVSETTTGDVYLRSTEAYGNNIICVIPKGSTVVYYSGTGWVKVKYNGITGYCGYKYLK